jgi:hypothetical protein
VIFLGGFHEWTRLFAGKLVYIQAPSQRRSLHLRFFSSGFVFGRQKSFPPKRVWRVGEAAAEPSGAAAGTPRTHGALALYFTLRCDRFKGAMKVRIACVLSLLANVVLAFIFVARQRPSDVAPSRQVFWTNQIAVIQTEVKDPYRARQLPFAYFEWRLIESDDYPAFIRNLRGIRCPERMIQHIVLSELRAQYAGRDSALRRVAVDAALNGSFAGIRTAEEALVKRWRLDQEFRALSQQLLGVAARLDADDFAPPRLEAWLGFLRPEESGAVFSAWQKARDSVAEIAIAGGGVYFPEDERVLEGAANEFDAFLSRRVAPEYLEELRLRLLVLREAEWNRAALAGIAATPDDLRALLRASPMFTNVSFQALGGVVVPPPEAVVDFQEALRQVLGEARYTEMARSRDPRFRGVGDFLSRANLSADLAPSIYELRLMGEEEIRNINETSQSEEEREEAVRQVRETLESTLSSLLGDENLEQFRAAEGQWIDKLAPPTASAEQANIVPANGEAP